MFEQLPQFFENIFSKYQCEFQKGFSTQKCLLAMLKLLTDILKAFDHLHHGLLIAKLNAYGFSLTALKLVYNYLSKRKQWTKINASYSSLLEIIFGVPQGIISRTSII